MLIKKITIKACGDFLVPWYVDILGTEVHLSHKRFECICLSFMGYICQLNRKGTSIIINNMIQIDIPHTRYLELYQRVWWSFLCIQNNWWCLGWLIVLSLCVIYFSLYLFILKYIVPVIHYYHQNLDRQSYYFFWTLWSLNTNLRGE